jgi:general stress protein CsbA
MTTLRFMLLLCLTIWIGALIFFPVVAQTSFSVLPSAHLAGLVVRNTLIDLHWMGLVTGIVFLVCSMIDNRVTVGRWRIFALSHILVTVMLALTAISQFFVIPRMDVLRITAGEISVLPASNPIRVEFDSLHAWSTRIEMTVLALGLLALYSVAHRFSKSRL